MRKRIVRILGTLCLLVLLGGCGARADRERTVTEAPAPAAETEASAPKAEATQAPAAEEPPVLAEEEEDMLQLWIGDTAVAVEWEDNESVAALRALCEREALTIPMTRYGGFEQVGPIGTGLPRSDAQTTTAPGDIVLYAGDQIVVFYGSNSWAYTRLGRITDQSAEALAALLGGGDVELNLRRETVS